MLKQKGEGRGKMCVLGVEKNPIPALMVWERAANQNKVCGGKP